MEPGHYYLDISRPMAGFHAGLQRILEFVTLTLTAVDGFPDSQSVSLGRDTLFSIGTFGQTLMPGTAKNMALSAPLPTPAVKTLSRIWLVRHSLTDAITWVNQHLESIRPIVVLLAGGTTTPDPEVWRTGLLSPSAVKHFHKLGLPEKFAELHTLGLPNEEVLADLELCAQSINAMRNCYVHRGGVVGRQDAGPGGEVMACRWARMVIFAKYSDGTSGEFDDNTAEEMRAVDTLDVRLEDPVEKAVPVGQRLTFSPQELHDVLWTLYRLGGRSGEMLHRLAVDQRLLPQREPQAPYLSPYRSRCIEACPGRSAAANSSNVATLRLDVAKRGRAPNASEGGHSAMATGRLGKPITPNGISPGGTKSWHPGAGRPMLPLPRSGFRRSPRWEP